MTINKRETPGVLIAAYTNGNTRVQLFSDGTKIREYEGSPKPLFPESIDVKITNFCDLGCPYCHETSNLSGAHAELGFLLAKLSKLPAGVEIAIGGGNPLAHPDLEGFLRQLNLRGIIANLTVNQDHIGPDESNLSYYLKNGLLRGLGISIRSNDFSKIGSIRKHSKNIVYHVICGKDKVEILDDLLAFDPGCKVLILGYKKFGRGVNFYRAQVEEEIARWARYLPRYIGKCHLSFDNLAIEQLDVKRLFTEGGWEKFYMGDDFTFSMYVDAVEGVFAPTSRSSARTSWDGCSLIKYFQGGTP